MNELIREIEEDIRQERLQKMWQSFGKIMVCVSIAVVLATIGIVIWQNYRETYYAEQTGKFMSATDRVNAGEYKEAIAAFGELTKNKGSSYYSLAMLHKAQAEHVSGDEEAARTTYRELSVDTSSNDRPYAMLAKILAATESDMPLESPSKDAPFYYTQTEWRAWQLLKQGKQDEALSLFTALKQDNDAPRTLRQRASEIASHINASKDAPHADQ